MQSIIVKDIIKEDDLRDSLSTFFKSNSVHIFDSLKKLQKEDILLELLPMQGDFKLQLFLYTELKFSIEELSVFICKQHKTEVLISDNTSNPYTWILINEHGSLGKVDQVPLENFFMIKKPED